MNRKTRAAVTAFAAAAGVTALCMGGGFLLGTYGLAAALDIAASIGVEQAATAGIIGGFATAVGIKGGPGSGIAERTYHAVHDYFDPPPAHRKPHAKPA
jgi:hypothetical protein